MLEHCVFCAITPQTREAEVESVFSRLASLVGEVEGMLSFHAGPNRDFERKSTPYSHGFICRFQDRDAHLAYERHPVHVAAGRDLVALCVGGHDGIIVFDLEITP